MLLMRALAPPAVGPGVMCQLQTASATIPLEVNCIVFSACFDPPKEGEGGTTKMAITQPSGAIRRLESGQVTDAVLSPDSKTIYVTAGKNVLAYSLTTGAQTGRWTIGSNLGALDVTADGTALVVVERTSGAVTGAGTSAYTVDQSVYKLDLASGIATTFTRATPGGSAYRDVVALADGTVLLSEGYYTYSATLTALDPRNGTFANGPAITRQHDIRLRLLFAVQRHHRCGRVREQRQLSGDGAGDLRGRIEGRHEQPATAVRRQSPPDREPAIALSRSLGRERRRL